MGDQPIAWALFNPMTGNVDHRCYQREDAADVFLALAHPPRPNGAEADLQKMQTTPAKEITHD